MRLLPKIEEDRPTPKEIYNFRTYLFAAIASAGAATIGYDSAFIGGTIALDSFKEEFSFAQKPPQEVDLISANIVSCYQAGAFFGAILAYLAGHFLGRRLGLLVFGPIFMLGAGLMLAASRERGLACIYAGRVIAGLSIGAISNLIPIYISELSPPAIRGRLVGMWEVGWQCGGLVGFWINYAVSRTLPSNHKQWIIPFAVQLIPAGILIAGALVTDESPRWLISNGKRQKGIQVLSGLRNLPEDHIYLREEIAQIDQQIEIQASSIGLGFNAPFIELWNNSNVPFRLFLAGSLFFWQNGSGINAINTRGGVTHREPERPAADQRPVAVARQAALRVGDPRREGGQVRAAPALARVLEPGVPEGGAVVGRRAEGEAFRRRHGAGQDLVRAAGAVAADRPPARGPRQVRGLVEAALVGVLRGAVVDLQGRGRGCR
ncbi:uncharacterized protein E0L32_001072 [Thyridium curvatum]|uniref:Quinate transporter n=1 Tax=Thyridium curvatum TaxID=1093900 RepID=A0A507AXS8_9PEZI|nr:uncharacterized protein E0L32_001072 [Thyridium curvatum]TPX11254.1 hypothetical protein E0L32_001072 [Thyridium curvatum]